MNARLSSLLVLTTLLMQGCQAAPKLPIPKPNPLVSAVQEKPDAYKSQRVTWGGVILATEAKENGTEIIILAKRLDSVTRPIESDAAFGRFIATVKGFVDPAVYAPGRELSVNGIVTGSENRKIGEYDYLYPVVSVDSHHLWHIRVRYEDDDYWWDPWYGPWYHPYPYYHRPPRVILQVN